MYQVAHARLKVTNGQRRLILPPVGPGHREDFLSLCTDPRHPKEVVECPKDV